MIKYCQIELSQGQVARVSPDDFDELCGYQWNANKCTSPGSFYASRMNHSDPSKPRVIKMHRQIMGFPRLDVDHSNGDTLDNRRHNLRLATRAQNSRNGKRRVNNTSGFKGVSLHRDNVWLAKITVAKKQIYLGTFTSPEEAHAAYCRAADRYHGEFARVA
jgi:hypothetical protein